MATGDMEERVRQLAARLGDMEERARQLAALLSSHAPGDRWGGEDMHAAAKLLTPRGGEELLISAGPYKGRRAVISQRGWHPLDDGNGPQVGVLVRPDEMRGEFYGAVRLAHFYLAEYGALCRQLRARAMGSPIP